MLGFTFSCVKMTSSGYAKENNNIIAGNVLTAPPPPPPPPSNWERPHEKWNGIPCKFILALPYDRPISSKT
jgi:hypothetical protein